MVDKSFLLKGSKVALIMFFLLTAGFIIAGGITSSEVDDVCATNEAVLERRNGQWDCSIIAYGEMYNYTSGGWTFPIGNNGIYYNITGTSMHHLSNINYTKSATQGDYFTINHDGMYKVDWSLSFSGGVNSEYGIGAMKNYDRTLSRDCYSRRHATTSVGNIGGTCIMNLSVGDTVNLQIEDEANPAQDVVIRTLSLNLERITHN